MWKGSSMEFIYPTRPPFIVCPDHTRWKFRTCGNYPTGRNQSCMWSWYTNPVRGKNDVLKLIGFCHEEYLSLNEFEISFLYTKKVNRFKDWKDFKGEHWDLNDFEDWYREFTEGERFQLDEEEYHEIENSDDDQESDDAENLCDDWWMPSILILILYINWYCVHTN